MDTEWFVRVAIIAAGLASVGALFRIMRAFVRIAARLDEAVPVLLQIADEFKAPTLKQRLVGVEGKVDEVDKKVHENTSKLNELHEYTHSWRHQLSNDLQKVLLKLDAKPNRGEDPTEGA